MLRRAVKEACEEVLSPRTRALEGNLIAEVWPPTAAERGWG